jgi:hypothetical protein
MRQPSPLLSAEKVEKAIKDGFTHVHTLEKNKTFCIPLSFVVSEKDEDIKEYNLEKKKYQLLFKQAKTLEVNPAKVIFFKDLL